MYNILLAIWFNYQCLTLPRTHRGEIRANFHSKLNFCLVSGPDPLTFIRLQNKRSPRAASAVKIDLLIKINQDYLQTKIETEYITAVLTI